MLPFCQPFNYQLSLLLDRGFLYSISKAYLMHIRPVFLVVCLLPAVYIQPNLHGRDLVRQITIAVNCWCNALQNNYQPIFSILATFLWVMAQSPAWDIGLEDRKSSPCCCCCCFCMVTYPQRNRTPLSLLHLSCLPHWMWSHQSCMLRFIATGEITLNLFF